MIDAGHIPATWRPSPAADVVALPVDDTLVLWGPAVLVPELLPRVEAVIWSFVDGGTSVGELAADIAEVFHATPDKALFDLQRLLTQWVHLGLVDDDVEGLDGSGEAGADPIPGPDPDRHPLQSPAVAPHGAVSDLVRWHEARKRVVRAGRLTFAVSIEDADDVPDLVDRLAPLTVDDDGRRRYAVLRQRRGDDADRPWLVLSDVGLPLLRTDDPAVVTDTVTRLVSEVVDRQTPTDVAWFRFASVERGDTAVLVQHELLYAYPALVAALAARGFTLHPADYVAVDDDGRLVRFANRLAADAPAITLDDPPRVDARRRIAGVVVAGGPELGPAPTTEAERRWLLALTSCIGHDPRADGWARRWAVTAPLARRRSRWSARARQPTRWPPSIASSPPTAPERHRRS